MMGRLMWQTNSIDTIVQNKYNFLSYLEIYDMQIYVKLLWRSIKKL